MWQPDIKFSLRVDTTYYERSSTWKGLRVDHKHKGYMHRSEFVTILARALK